MAHLLNTQQPLCMLDILPAELFENIAKELSDSIDIKALRAASRECAAKISAVYNGRRFSDFSIDFEDKASLIAGVASARRPTVFGAETRNVTIKLHETLRAGEPNASFEDFCDRAALLEDIFTILKKSEGIALHMRINSDLPRNRRPDLWSSFETILHLIESNTLELSELSIDVQRSGYELFGALPMKMLFFHPPCQSDFQTIIHGLRSLKLALSVESPREHLLAEALASMPNLCHLSLLKPLEDGGEEDKLHDPLMTCSLRSLVTLELDGFTIMISDLKEFIAKNKIEKLTLANALLLLGPPGEDDSLWPEETLNDGLERIVDMPVVTDHKTRIDYDYNHM